MTGDPGPRGTAAGWLEIDPQTWAPQDLYFLINALVVPRPIAWVSSRSADGVPNLAPHSYFTPISTDPPVVGFVSLGRKDTLANITSVGEFVVNIASRRHLEAMNVTAAAMPIEHDEFAWAGLAPCASRTVSVPGVADAPVRLECVLDSIVERGNGHLILGAVRHIAVSEQIWVDGRVDVGLLDPVCRLAGSEYAVLGERLHLPRPTWEQVRDRSGRPSAAT